METERKSFPHQLFMLSLALLIVPLAFAYADFVSITTLLPYMAILFFGILAASFQVLRSVGKKLPLLSLLLPLIGMTILSVVAFALGSFLIGSIAMVEVGLMVGLLVYREKLAA